MLEEEANNERGILDNLNEDCWRAVLQYVPVWDLIRTERASRRWQELVLTYLRGIRINVERQEWKQKKHPSNTCTLKPSEYKSFESWTKKLGAAVASIYCTSVESLAMIKENCPNIEALEVCRIGSIYTGKCTHKLHDNFKFLRQVSFYRCSMGDGSFTKFLEGRSLEKLEFRYCRNFTGLCFPGIDVSKLKYLCFEACNQLQPTKFGFIECLGELVELKLINCQKDVGYDVQFSLEMIPKLERVELRGGIMLFGFHEHVAQLPRLQHLSVTYELDRGDLEDILQGCKELRSLELLCCQYMSGVIDVICCRGTRLTSLKLAEFGDAKDDDVLRLVQACPALEVLTVAGTRHLTRTLPARAAAASPGRRLRLHLGDTNLGVEYNKINKKAQGPERSAQREEMKTKYENLIVVFEKTIGYDGSDKYDEDSGEECMEWYEDCEDEEWEDVDESEEDGDEFEEDGDQSEEDED